MKLNSTEYAYISNQTLSGDPIVSVVNLSTHQIIKEINLKEGNLPYPLRTLLGIAITPDYKHLFICGNNQVVSKVELATGAITNIPIEGFMDAVFVAITPDGRSALITDFDVFNVALIDVASNQVSQIDNNEYYYSNSSGIAVTPDGNKAFFLAKDNDNLVVCVIDVISRKIINQIKIGRQDSLDPFIGLLSISPDGQKVYVPNHIARTISVIDAQKEIVLYEIGRFEGADNCVPFAVAVARSGKIGYVTLVNPFEDNSYLFSFDLKAGASPTPRMVQYTSNSFLVQCAFNAIGSRVYAVDYFNKRLIEVDAATNQVVGQGVSGFSEGPAFIAITPLPYPKIAPTLDNAIKYLSPIKMQKGL